MNGDSWLEDMARKSRESGLGALAQPRRYRLAPCTGLHCTRPECRKRRKERLRLEWTQRESTRPARQAEKMQRLMATREIMRTPAILQDDRWRAEVEERSRNARLRGTVAFGRRIARKLIGCCL